MARVGWGREVVAVVAVVVAGVGCSSGGDDGGSAASGSDTDVGGVLYRDPDTQVGEWVADHPDDPRRTVLRDRIAVEPQARWFIEPDPDTIGDEVRAYVEPAVAAGEVPVLVPYTIADRDCGGASSGGAADLGAWQRWIDGLAEGLADGLGDARALVVLEPDSLAQEDCLDTDGVAARHAALATAVATIGDAAPGAEVYLDAGHSDWNSAADQAERLREAGVLDAAGFATNVSNFNTTADEVAYGDELLDALGDPDLRQVIDVSRNGNGPAPEGEWCDPPGRAVGDPPTLDTGVATVAAYLWVKLPGEADGCAATPGTFLPDVAAALAAG